MKYINDYHQQLTRSQESGLAAKIQNLKFDSRVGIIAAALFSGLAASAMAWQGTSSTRVYFCIKSPTGEICADEKNRPFRMTPHHWQQWELNGRPKQITLNRLEFPTNPGKPIQAGWAFVSFAVAGWMLRQLQFNENQKSKWDGVAQERDEAIANLETQMELMETARDLELITTDNAVIIQQAEILGEVEIKLTQLEAAETIFEAETAGMTEEQKQNYVEFVRNQQTPFLSGNQTLSKTIDPNDKVSGTDNKTLQPDWVSHAINYFCVLIWGGQGSGKTTAASHIIKGKKDRGDKIIVLDPHAARGQWEGLEVIGAGMDYEAIDKFMGWYEEEAKHRYQLLRNEGEEAVKKLGSICVVAEELTNYAKRCKNSGDFIQACLSDNRKIFFSSISISHGRTLALTGGSQGTAKTRDDSFLELHCIAPTGGNDRAWEIKYPGSEFSSVSVPEWETIYDFGETVAVVWRNERNDDTAALSTDKKDYFGRFGMTRNEILEEIDKLRNEMKLSQTQILKILWGAKPGDNEAYKNAVSEFKQLTDSQ
ncbi:type IV secretion system DNA-binding domain-containing protein [Anabaena aphanizomenioides LEGE 00250]|uniref:Type IV secretion system DNA-binding domain-containing protein n=1 Tax=Sphaerospermopsis aphanizomenoides LEGE 00250 TaxID=2777972 RepID=A0ABR9VCI5_9CYAN|nr:type IV secretion system DNA-binding domain-containing protein [Sphaerospermopsis aphanizomenoides]MBE9235842.1 type IV secretion system DNA-binding domain-containing protein [Sphaerospermopsis aphanizomenoides LEGE 00250]